MERLGLENDTEREGAAVVSTNGVRVFGAAPSLAFTKPIKATIDGKTVQNPNWASILHFMIACVRAKGFEGETLVRELGIPSKAHCYDDEGYKYIAELGISVQGQSAADAWKEADRLANKWRIPTNVEFVWRPNPKAQHPGEQGVLRSGGL